MTKTAHTVGRILLLASLLLLTACNVPTANLTPTVDPNAIATSAAATVWAQVTQNLALTPSATITPIPTETTLPTETMTPTLGTPQPTVAAGTLSSTQLPDQALYISQSITDKTAFKPGTKFTMIWRLRNIGSTTWTPNYKLRFYSGNNFSAPKEIVLKKEVKPLEEVEISVDMTAPSRAGSYRSDWVMSNAFGLNFNMPVFLEIVVASGTAAPTETTTPTPSSATATATETPTPSVTPTSGS